MTPGELSSEKMTWQTPGYFLDLVRKVGPIGLVHQRREAGMRGEGNPRAKLTAPLVAQLRAERAETGLSYAKLAAKYGVTAMTVHGAIAGKTWKEAR